MSSYNHFDSSSSSPSLSYSSSNNGGIEAIYRGAAIAANVYERQQQKKRPHRGGSMHSRRYIPRDRIGADKILKRDYFDEGCTYTDETFRLRFRMKKSLFMKIHDAVLEHDPMNFEQRPDAAKKLGLSSLQKVTAAIRILAHGLAADQCDEYLKVAESTAIKSMKDFCTAVNKIFAGKYLRTPTKEDIQHILVENAAKGFQDMLGSLDCMHWKWRNYPKGWHDSHVNGKIGAPTLILEAVATCNLWIWHCFFGMVGTNNDLNVLDNSHLFDRIVSGEAPTCNFVVNGHAYTMGYYLSDGIYPKWATLIQTISQPVIAKHKHFAQVQEEVRKYVERAFGVLQARFAIVKGSVRLWDREECGLIMKTCIILHNMIVENEEDPEEWAPPEDEACESVAYNRDANLLRSNHINRIKSMTNEVTHSQLKLDLIEHLWNCRGDGDL